MDGWMVSVVQVKGNGSVVAFDWSILFRFVLFCLFVCVFGMPPTVASIVFEKVLLYVFSLSVCLSDCLTLCLCTFCWWYGTATTSRCACRVKLLRIGCSLMLAALIALTIAFMFDYVSEDDCNDNTTDSTCSAYSDKCEW